MYFKRITLPKETNALGALKSLFSKAQKYATSDSPVVINTTGTIGSSSLTSLFKDLSPDSQVQLQNYIKAFHTSNSKTEREELRNKIANFALQNNISFELLFDAFLK